MELGSLSSPQLDQSVINRQIIQKGDAQALLRGKVQQRSRSCRTSLPPVPGTWASLLCSPKRCIFSMVAIGTSPMVPSCPVLRLGT